MIKNYWLEQAEQELSPIIQFDKVNNLTIWGQWKKESEECAAAYKRAGLLNGVTPEQAFRMGWQSAASKDKRLLDGIDKRFSRAVTAKLLESARLVNEQ